MTALFQNNTETLDWNAIETCFLTNVHLSWKKLDNVFWVLKVPGFFNSLFSFCNWSSTSDDVLFYEELGDIFPCILILVRKTWLAKRKNISPDWTGLHSAVLWIVKYHFSLTCQWFGILAGCVIFAFVHCQWFIIELFLKIYFCAFHSVCDVLLITMLNWLSQSLAEI